MNKQSYFSIYVYSNTNSSYSKQLISTRFITYSPMDTPSVWTTSGNNRIHQWNLLDATCERSLIVKDQKQGEVPVLPVTLENISLNVGDHW